MTRRFTSLRLRLVLGFLLVSVPPMLAAAYVAARLISNAFETNVEQWLGETAGYFKLEVAEAAGEAEKVAGVVAARLEGAGGQTLDIPATIEKELALLDSVGYDLYAVYSPKRAILYASRPFEAQTDLPLEARQGVFQVTSGGKSFIMSGAARPIRFGGDDAFLLVGTWIDDIYLGGMKAVTSLDLRLYARDGADFAPVIKTLEEGVPARPVPASVIDELSRSDEPVVGMDGDADSYKSVFSGLRGVNGKLVAFVFIGLRSSEGFYEQIGGPRLFLGIFLLGSLRSVLVGVAMSHILVQP